VNFLIDAQLPRRLGNQLREAGHDATHTLDLPLANRTPDAAILRLATLEARVVITKDADFVNSFLLHRLPPKLLLVSTGNIANAELETLFASSLAQIVRAFSSADFVELTRSSLVVHT
jgi:predicted nuclease of predicted toxin-antitoxin system